MTDADAQGREQRERAWEFFKTNNDAAIKSGEEAIKALILINGGSSVAMLAFIGTLALKDQQTSQQIAILARPLIGFASGVGLAVAAACSSYLVNSTLAELARTRMLDSSRSVRWRWVVEGLRALTIAFAVGSLFSFGWGVWTAKRGFEQLPAVNSPAAGPEKTQLPASHPRRSPTVAFRDRGPAPRSASAG
jgi:hypothetical protein